MIWHPIRCMAGRERAIRDELHGQRVSALVPVRFVQRRIARGEQRRMVPLALLPGYVFAGLERDADWLKLARIRGWLGPLQIAGRIATLTPREVQAVELMSQPPSGPSPIARYKLGDRIKVKVGAMAELDALVTRLDGARVIGLVELLGKRHEVVVEADHAPRMTPAAITQPAHTAHPTRRTRADREPAPT